MVDIFTQLYLITKRSITGKLKQVVATNSVDARNSEYHHLSLLERILFRINNTTSDDCYCCRKYTEVPKYNVKRIVINFVTELYKKKMELDAC